MRLELFRLICPCLLTLESKLKIATNVCGKCLLKPFSKNNECTRRTSINYTEVAKTLLVKNKTEEAVQLLKMEVKLLAFLLFISTAVSWCYVMLICYIH